MTTKHLENNIDVILEAVGRELKAAAMRLAKSGGVDYGDEPNDSFVVPKAIVCAALHDQANHFGLSDVMKKIVKNLKHF